MNALVINRNENTVSRKSRYSESGIDAYIFSALLIAANIHLVTGNFDTSFIFFPSSVKAGEWWRLITYPFVHVTWYHLLLDAGAFFILYRDISDNSFFERMFYLIVSGSFSLAAALISSPVIDTIGLTGLSGIAHGLMAVSALQMLRSKNDFRIGLILFIIVVAKSIYETAADDVLFSFMHLGLCGLPIAASHMGGVLGGIFAYCAVRMYKRMVKRQIL
jgi:rhomboid family GlyGly-CTERM serine protease